MQSWLSGVYQYVIGSLSFGFKVVVGFAGIGGSKSKGLELLYDSAARGVISSFVPHMSRFFLRREAKYKQAIAIVRTQIKEYPHNFLFALEEANLLKDDGQGQVAITAYRKISTTPRSVGIIKVRIWSWRSSGSAIAFAARGSTPTRSPPYEQASAQPTTSPELKRRSLLAAGEVYDLMHQHDKARDEYLAVVAAGSDTSQADLARKYMRNAFTQ